MRLGLSLHLPINLQARNTVTPFVMTWDGETTDSTPDFAGFIPKPLVGDLVTINLYTSYVSGLLSGLFDTASYSLLSGDLTADPATINIPLGTQPNGTYFAQSTVKRGGVVIYQSAVSTVVISVGGSSIAPVTLMMIG